MDGHTRRPAGHGPYRAPAGRREPPASPLLYVHAPPVLTFGTRVEATADRIRARSWFGLGVERPLAAVGASPRQWWVGWLARVPSTGFSSVYDDLCLLAHMVEVLRPPGGFAARGDDAWLAAPACVGGVASDGDVFHYTAGFAVYEADHLAYVDLDDATLMKAVGPGPWPSRWPGRRVDIVVAVLGHLPDEERSAVLVRLLSAPKPPFASRARWERPAVRAALERSRAGDRVVWLEDDVGLEPNGAQAERLRAWAGASRGTM